jgi:hypothetical protein
MKIDIFFSLAWARALFVPKRRGPIETASAAVAAPFKMVRRDGLLPESLLLLIAVSSL